MRIPNGWWRRACQVVGALMAGGLLSIAGCGQGSAGPVVPEPARQTVKLELERTIPLGSAEGAASGAAPVGRLDHLVYDVGSERLFLAAVAEGRLEVVDLKAGQWVQAIGGLEEAQGVALDPTRRWVYVSSGGGGTVTALDVRTLEKKATVVVGEDADNLRFAAQTGRVLVGCGAGRQATVKVLNAATLAPEQSIALTAHPEAFACEPDGSRVYINVPGAEHAAQEGVVVAARCDTGAVEATWKLPGAGGNFPMALDATQHRLYVAGRNPARLAAVATGDGRVLAAVTCVGDCDDIWIDQQNGLIVLIGGGERGEAATGGAIEVYRYSVDGKLTRVTAVAVPSLTRTGLWVPERRRLYVAVPGAPGRPAAIREYRLTEGEAATPGGAAGGR